MNTSSSLRFWNHLNDLWRNKRVFVRAPSPLIGILNMEEIHFPHGVGVLYLGCLGGRLYFSFACVLSFRSKDSEHLQRRRNRDGFSWVLTTGTLNGALGSLGRFLSEAGCIKKYSKLYTAREGGNILSKKTKINMSLPQFGYKPLKTFPANSHTYLTHRLN